MKIHNAHTPPAPHGTKRIKPPTPNSLPIAVPPEQNSNVTVNVNITQRVNPTHHARRDFERYKDYHTHENTCRVMQEIEDGERRATQLLVDMLV